VARILHRQIAVQNGRFYSCARAESDSLAIAAKR
jgi:hypothetical protein